MKPIYKAWTDIDDDRLKTFLADGSSAARAAAALGRTIKNVKVRARKLGSPFPPDAAARKKLSESPSNIWPRGRPRSFYIDEQD